MQISGYLQQKYGIHNMNEILKDPSDFITGGPDTIISGSGPGWFFNPLDKIMIRTTRGTRIKPFSDVEDELGRKLVYYDGYVILIPADEIIELGYN